MKLNLFFASLAIATVGTTIAAPQVPMYTKIALPEGVSNQYFRGNIVFADINADNNMDLLLKGRDLGNNWSTDVFSILTDNDGVFTSKLNLANDGEAWDRTLTILDFNNDGLLDYLLVNSGYELYRNEGNGAFTKVENFTIESILDLGGDNTEARYTGVTALADFNLDGYQDIVIYNGDGNPTLYTNNLGDGSFTKVENSGLYAQRGGTMAVGDFNKDGYPDLAVSGWSDVINNDCIRINKNNGDGTFTVIAPETLVGSEKGQITFVDADSDGFLDLFVTGESCPEGWAKIAYLFKNNGDETFTKVPVSLTGACKGSVDWVDVNSDGHMDIVYCGETSNENRAVIAINEGNLNFTGHENLLCKARGGAVIATYDVNKNGFPCIAIMGYNDDNTGHMNVFNGFCSRNPNVAPTAPTEATMTSGNGNVIFSWKAGSDIKTPTLALRYNIYVKLTNSKLITVVPADPESGSLRLADVNASLTTCSYKLNIKAEDIAEWGVQTIDGGKLTSEFAKGSLSGITGVVSENGLKVNYINGQIIISDDAEMLIYNASGRVLMNTMVTANEPRSISVTKGIYFVKVITADSIVVKKIMMQ